MKKNAVLFFVLIGLFSGSFVWAGPPMTKVMIPYYIKLNGSYEFEVLGLRDSSGKYNFESDLIGGPNDHDMLQAMHACFNNGHNIRVTFYKNANGDWEVISFQCTDDPTT